MAIKPSIPKGTRDFSPIEVAQRNYIFNIIKGSFELFGFQPIETPSFENSDTLMGKYGEEGDRLIFKILNSGDYLSKVDKDNLIQKNSLKLTPQISEKALRYDLTVPFARYVVQHQNELVFPFKRYQMQPVWRADRPQKGRYREFYQCDADVVGSTSLWQEVSLIQLYDDAFTKLKFSQTRIKLNNRKILSGLAEMIGAQDKLIDFTVALDKLDKIGIDGVTKEMLSKDISQEAIDKVKPLFQFKGTNQDKLQKLRDLLKDSKVGLKGVDELQFVVNAIENIALQSANLVLDVTLARGLNYYTGAIFEVEIPDVGVGSVGGGGRYDDLTGIFGLEGVGGIGISFGLDRIYLALEARNLFEAVSLPKPRVLFINFGDAEALYATKCIKVLRQNNISSELYPDAVKMNKQMIYANKRMIDFVVLAGSLEIENEQLTLKNMKSGIQRNCSLKTVIEILKNS